MIWVLLACTGQPTLDGQKATPATLTDTGTPGLPDIGETQATPSMTAEEVAQTIALAMSTPPDPDEIIDTYLWLMGEGDTICPGDPLNITDIWLYGCDASTGYSYAGVTEWIDDIFVEGPIVGTVKGLAGDFWIDTPEGHQLEAGGHSVKISSETVWIAEIAGSWAWSDGPDWLSSGSSGNLTQEYIKDIYVAFRGAANISGIHIAGHDLTFPEACGGHPVGSVSLRDPTGGWYRLDFPSCDSCTDVVFEGTSVGEACVDFSQYIEIIKGKL